MTAMRQSKESYSRSAMVVREKSDLSSSRKLERRNEAAARERLGSLSRAVSVDAYTEGQGRKTMSVLMLGAKLELCLPGDKNAC